MCDDTSFKFQKANCCTFIDYLIPDSHGRCIKCTALLLH